MLKHSYPYKYLYKDIILTAKYHINNIITIIVIEMCIFKYNKGLLQMDSAMRESAKY